MVTEEQLDEAGRRLAEALAVVVYISDFEVYAHYRPKRRRQAMRHSRQALRRFGYSYDEIDKLDDALEAREMTRCRDCDAEIVWAQNRTTGRTAPINAVPVEGGNIALHGDGTYSVDGGLLGMPDTDGLQYISHFVTCPAAEERRVIRNRKRRTG